MHGVLPPVTGWDSASREAVTSWGPLTLDHRPEEASSWVTGSPG